MWRGDSDSPGLMMPAPGALASSSRTKLVRNSQGGPVTRRRPSVAQPQPPKVRQSSAPRFRAGDQCSDKPGPLVPIQEREADQRRHQCDCDQTANAATDQKQRGSARPGIEAECLIVPINPCPLALLKQTVVGASCTEPVENPPWPVAERDSRRWSSGRCHNGYLDRRGW